MPAQFSNVYISHYDDYFSDSTYGHHGINFYDSIPQKDSISQVSFKASQDGRFYLSAQGNLVLCLIEENYERQNNVFLLPSQKLIYTAKMNTWVDFLPRDDSTFWMIESDSFKYRVLNYYTGEITQQDTQKFGYGQYAGYDIMIPHKNGYWLVEFMDEFEDLFGYLSVYVNEEGVKQITKKADDSLLVRLYNGWNSHERGNFAWNAKLNKIAWIVEDYFVQLPQKDHYMEYTSLLSGDFDLQTGIISNQIQVRTDTVEFIALWRQPWVGLTSNWLTSSIAYSPNGKYLYRLECKPILGSDEIYVSRVLQENVETGEIIPVIEHSEDILDSAKNTGTSGLYNTPDGRIYIFPFDYNSPNMWVFEIRFPDNSGEDCDVRKAFLGERDLQFSNTQSYYEKRIHIGQTNVCTPKHQFVNEGDQSFTQLRWNFIDMDTTLLFTEYGDSVKCPLKTAGSYLVLLRGEDDNGFVNWHWDSIYYSPPVEAKVALIDSVACAYNSVRFADSSKGFGSTEPYSWKWKFNKNGQLLKQSEKQHPEVVFTENGTYSVGLTFSNGVCSDSTELTQNLLIKNGPKPGFSLSDSIVCAPDSIRIIDSSQGLVVNKEFKWSDGFTSKENHVRYMTEPDKLWIVQTLKGPNGCMSTDSQSLHVLPGRNQFGRPELLRATVPKEAAVQLNWLTIPQVAGYELNRFNNHNLSAKYYFNTPEKSVFIDSPLTINDSFWLYKLYPIDSCGRLGYESNLASSILLKVENHNNRFAILNWNAYQNWTEGISEYVVESSTNKIDWLPIDVSKQLAFPDYRIADLDVDSIWYRIKAVEMNGNQQVSISNEVKVLLTSTLFIPNAFTPNNDGINDVFKISSFGLKNFSCKIYARNGQRVAFSENPNTIWDGELNGVPLPLGVYQYIIYAETEKGDVIEESGNVTLIR
ncbi:MAG: gliding motility-associated C-terminal domain-containing protein [Bacteroidetes bacterium]|nr:gliding motility-associated C-terminal domain-containing protein [Bacteroidota bacterium]